VAPYALCSKKDESNYSPAFDGPSKGLAKMASLASVDIVITSDKSKWTRCPVIEMCYDKVLAQGGVKRFSSRASQSVDKEGNPAPVGSGPSNNPNDPNYINEKGMGWFPGYAINLETGERLNMAFGENSWLAQYNGRDMLWNPVYATQGLFETIFGGMHYVYVFGHNKGIETGYPEFDGPAYDAGKWARDLLDDNIVDQIKRYCYANMMWVSIPVLQYPYNVLDCDVKIRLRVSKPYTSNYSTYGSDNPQNGNYPMYTFSTGDIATRTNNNSSAVSALDLINIVPNPYYAYSGYETDQLDNRVKIVNLPDKCTISIYNISGTMIRQYKKDGSTTSIDWDLKNHAGIPIAGGIYLIHVKAEGVGEKVIKWFGSLRPVDLNSF
jgi:hypothetical protein